MRQQPPAVQAIVDFFENLGPAQVERLGVIYADDARFQDPFNDVQGLAAIEAIPSPTSSFFWSGVPNVDTYSQNRSGRRLEGFSCMR